MYFDTDGLLAMVTYRKYGCGKEYDADGHVVAVICLDSDRNTMNDSSHYTIIRKTHYADGKLHTKRPMIKITPQCAPETINASSFI